MRDQDPYKDIDEDLDEDKLENLEQYKTNLEALKKAARKYDVKKEILSLFVKYDEHFYAAFSSRVVKKKDWNIPTAGVSYNEDTKQFELRYNPMFMVQIPHERGRAAILKHEFQHCFFEHVTKRKPEAYQRLEDMDEEKIREGGDEVEELKKKADKWNIAFDLAINSNIKEELQEYLPDGMKFWIPGEREAEDLPIGKVSQWYYTQLDDEMMEGGEPDDCPVCGGSGHLGEEDQEQDGGGGGDEQHDEEGEEQQAGGGGESEAKEQQDGDNQQQGGGGQQDDDQKGPPCPACQGTGEQGNSWQFDEHKGWADDDEDRQEKERRMKDIMKDAMRETKKRSSWGDTSKHIKKYLNQIFQPTINWKRKLQKFVQKSQKNGWDYTRKRPNRRWGLAHPGKRDKYQANLAVCIDQSGSVSDSLLAEFFAELAALSEEASFTVVPFDADVADDGIFRWEKGDNHEVERVSCGGTDFDPPTDWVNEHSEFDGMVVLTDMQAPKPGDATVPRLWVKPESCVPPFDTREEVIEIEGD